MKNRKPDRYWAKEENAVAEARKIIEQYRFKTLPSSDKLNELGYSGLVTAISEYHGGFHTFRELLGEKQKRREMNVWKDLDYAVEQARKVMQENGFETLPTKKILCELGYSSLNKAIVKYHGGRNEFRRLLGEVVEEKPDWQNLGYTVEQARKVMKDHGYDTLPTQRELSRLGRGDLSSAISRNHDGFHRFRELLGEKPMLRKSGTFKDFNYVVEQLKEIMETNRLSSLPSTGKLRELGYSTLADAISKYHGGHLRFRELFGEEQKQVENGTWKNLDYVVEQARKAMQEHGFESLPNSDTLNNLGYSSLVGAIHKYYGGFHKFRKILGQKQKEREKGLLKNLDYVIGEIERIIKKHKLAMLPGDWTLKKLGYSSLGAAINKYHGGFLAFREILNQRLGIQAEKQQLENLLDGYLEQ